MADIITNISTSEQSPNQPAVKTQCDFKITRSDTKYKVEYNIKFARTNSGYTTEGTVDWKIYLNDVEQKNGTTKGFSISDKNVYKSIASGSFEVTLDALSSTSITLGYYTDSSTGNLCTKDIINTSKTTISAYALKVGKPTITITDTGNNSFTIAATKGINGTNNNATGVSTISYSLDSANYNLTYAGTSIPITQDTVVYARAKTIGEYGESDYGTANANIYYKSPVVKCYVKYNGELKMGTLYTKNSYGEFKPVKELYQKQNEGFVRVK